MRGNPGSLAGLLLALFVGVVAAGDPPKQHGRRKQVKSDTIASMTSRIVNNRWRCLATQELYTLVPDEDDKGDEIMFGMVEFSDGSIGFYVARENEEDDEWISLTRKQVRSEMFSTVLKRSASR